MKMKRRIARLCILGAALVPLTVTALPAFAGTITAADCLAKGGTIVDHGSWAGCRDGSPSDTLIKG